MIMFSINEYINSQRYSSLLLSSLCVSFYFCSVELLDQTKPGPQHFVTSNSSKIGILVHGVETKSEESIKMVAGALLAPMLSC